MNNIGTDLVEISRIKEQILKHGELFTKRLFTDQEIAYCEKYTDPAHYYAGRFAAKEAIAKALGTGFGKELSWKDIEILPDDKGKPIVTLSEELRNKLQDPKILLSISHAREMAIAFAIYL